jgi:CheY-like chemotaxis protein
MLFPNVRTRRIKADPALRSIPIIAVTSFALDGEEQTARAAGCDDYVPEPYSPRQRSEACGTLMPASASERPSARAKRKFPRTANNPRKARKPIIANISRALS